MRFNTIRGFFRDPLYNNTIFITLTSLLIALSGFLFWIIAAKIYPADTVGIATVLISSSMLLIVLSRGGLDNSSIKYFNKFDRNSVFITSIVVTTLISAILGTIFIFSIDFWSPSLHFLQSPIGLLYILFLIAISISTMTGIFLIAIREGKFRFGQSIVLSSRLVFLFPLISFGFLGIFGAAGISFILSAILGIIILYRDGFRLNLKLNLEYLKESFNFSINNYISGMLSSLPIQILPIITLNILGSENTAYFYIAFTVASVLNIIPTAISTSLFVEGSYEANLAQNCLKSLTVIIIVLTPMIILFYFFGGFILNLFGKNYIIGLDLLRLLVISSIFVAIFQLYTTIKRIQNDMRSLTCISALLFSLLMITSYIFMSFYGLVGIGYAWMLSYFIGSIIALMTFKKWVTLSIIYRMMENLQESVRQFSSRK